MWKEISQNSKCPSLSLSVSLDREANSSVSSLSENTELPLVFRLFQPLKRLTNITLPEKNEHTNVILMRCLRVRHDSPHVGWDFRSYGSAHQQMLG